VTGPQDPAAAGRDQLRAGHADRDEVIEVLKDAFVDGRLSRDEFGARAGRALAARTLADLAVLIADLPPAPVWPAPAPAVPVHPSAAACRWPLVQAAAKSSLCLVLAFAAILAGVHFDPDGFGPHQAWAEMFFLPAIALVITAFGVLAAGAATAVEQRRARQPLPPGPGPGQGRSRSRGPGPGRGTARHHRAGDNPGPPGLPPRPGRRRVAGAQVTAAPPGLGLRASRARDARPPIEPPTGPTLHGTGPSACRGTCRCGCPRS